MSDKASGGRTMRWLSTAVLAITLLVLIAGSAGSAVAQEATTSQTQTVLVFAAASTSDAIREIKQRYTQTSGVRVLTSYGSSATLAQQIANGADADVFVSADIQWAEHLARQGVVVQSQTILGNRLVIVVPVDSMLNVQSPKDLLDARIEHLALGDPDSVPAGKYAKQALVKLGLWERLKRKVASADNVRHALAYVETGAAEAGIVYATDAIVGKRVRVSAEIAESLTGPIRYPVALLKHGQHNTAAKSFFEHLRSPEALKTFRKYGFTPLIEAETAGKPGQ